MPAIQHRRLRSREHGFTLVELLVVILIIGVLASIAIPVFLQQRKKGVDASIKADLHQVAMLQEQYISDHPGEAGTNDWAALGAFRKSDPGTRYMTTYRVGHGYCVVGQNMRMTGAEEAGAYWWYDSAGGGLISKKASNALPAGAVACDFAREPWSPLF